MKFVKLQAAGNDFIVIDARSLEQDWSTMAIKMCDRHFGVGADGLILVLSSDVADFGMRIINSDGSEAEICGNGLRCFARYVIENKLINGTIIEVATLSGNRTVQVFLDNGEVVSAKANMGKPRFKADEVPVTIDKDIYKQEENENTRPVTDYPLDINGNELKLSFISMGNPHAVLFIDVPVDDFPLSTIILQQPRMCPGSSSGKSDRLLRHSPEGLALASLGAVCLAHGLSSHLPRCS